MRSAEPVTIAVAQPGTGESVPMTQLCQTGGVVNLFRAVEMASQTNGKRKLTKEEKILFGE